MGNQFNFKNSFRAQLRTKEDGDGRHAFLKADGQYELDTVAKGDLKTPQVRGAVDSKENLQNTEFQATNERFNFQLNPQSHDNHTGAGTLSFADAVSIIFSFI